MLEKRVNITNHFYRKAQSRAKNHLHRLKKSDIENKIKNILRKYNFNDLICCKKRNGQEEETYFLKTTFSREQERPFYLLFVKNTQEDSLNLVTIYTEEMLSKRYRRILG